MTGCEQAIKWILRQKLVNIYTDRLSLGHWHITYSFGANDREPYLSNLDPLNLI